jgi:hypothetical protein
MLAAGLGALATTAARADGTVDFKFLRYQESDHRTEVSNPELFWQQDFGERGQFGLLLAYDEITGASPTGEIPSLDAASGASASASDIPMVEYSDTRRAATASYSLRMGSHLPAVSLSFSDESDYLSRGGSISDAWDLFGQRSTLHVGLGITRDRIEPVNMRERFTKDGLSASIGWTQVLGARDLIDISYGLESLDGYLTDPYKSVSVPTIVDGVPTLVARIENRPDSRRRNSVVFKYGHYFLSRGATKLSYRYYWDDWKVDAHTLEMSHDQRIGRRFILTPRVRFHTQDGADFFSYEYDEAQTYMSSDYRLSAFWSWLAGIGFSVEIGDHVSFSLAAAYQDQIGIDAVTPAQMIVPAAALEEEDEDEDEGGPGDISPADMQVLTAIAGLSFKF